LEGRARDYISATEERLRWGRFQKSKLFEQLFEEIVRQCVEVGLVQGKQLSVDGSFLEANAAKESRIPREELAEAESEAGGEFVVFSASDKSLAFIGSGANCTTTRSSQEGVLHGQHI
jgi:hypothetical protein